MVSRIRDEILEVAGGNVSSMVFNSLAERDAIPSSARFVGMEARVVGDGYVTLYQLLGGTSDGYWTEVKEDGTYGLSTHADLATVPVEQLAAGRRFTVDTDGTQWEYTGLESGAPDPSSEDAWDIVGPAKRSWFFDPAFPLADSRTVYIDQDTGSDVFNDGYTTSPFKTISRALNALRDETGFIGPAGFGPSYFIEYQGGSKADFSGAEARFAKTASLSVNVIAERAPVDLDGYGTTEISWAGSINRDLTGPTSTGTVAKFSQYRQDTGVTLLPSVQQPPSDGYYWTFQESDFGFTGFRLFTANMPCTVHDTGGALTATDIAMCGGGFGTGVQAGDVTNIVSTFVTQVDGSSGSFVSFNLPENINLRFYGFDFLTDFVAQSASNIRFVGNFQFSGCKFGVGKQSGSAPGKLQLQIRQPAVGNIFPLFNCTIIGVGQANGDDYVVVDAFGGPSTQPGVVNMNSNNFVNAGVLLAQGRFEVHTNIFRGIDSPEGNNGLGGRIQIGTTNGNTDQSVIGASRCARSSQDFERAPGEGAPAKTSNATVENGALYVVHGNGNSLTFSGGQGSTSVDADGRFWIAGYGARINTPTAGTWFGNVTRPLLMRSGAGADPSVLNGNNVTGTGTLTNVTGNKTVTNGGDIQLGRVPSGSGLTELVYDFADAPVSDVSRGNTSEGVIFR